MLKRETVRLLRRVKKHILEEPKRLYMRDWAHLKSGAGAPKCGTVGCIAGWAHLLTHKKEIGTSQVDDIHEGYGMDALNVDSTQAVRLFYVSGWPEKFEQRYLRAKTRKQEAKVAAERIEHFIKTHGEE